MIPAAPPSRLGDPPLSVPHPAGAEVGRGEVSLLLSAVTEEDLEDLWRLHADPAAYRLDTTEPLTDREQMRWVLGCWIAAAAPGLGYVTLREDDGTSGAGPLHGVLGLTEIEHGDMPLTSLYYRLSPTSCGRGLGTASGRALLEAALLARGPHRVVVVTNEANAPSLALARRLGFREPDEASPVPGGRGGDVLLERRLGEDRP